MALIRVSRLPLRSPTIPPSTHTNCYLIGNQTLLLVDPGSAYPREVQKLLEAIYRRLGNGCQVMAVLLTHHHPDHVAGARQVAEALGVPIIAHPHTLERLPASATAQRPLAPGDGLVLAGEGTLQLLHTPGHAEGHLCLWEPAARWLLAGDMLMASGTVVIAPPEGDMSRYLASLRTLAALDPRLIYPGHGPPLRSGRLAIEQLIAHRLQREARVLSVLAPRPQTLLEITRQAYAELPARLLPLASRTALAHLHKLVAEGCAAAAGDRWTLLGKAPPGASELKGR